MEALACLEVRRIGWMLTKTKWKATMALLDQLGFYTSCFQSYAVDDEVMEALAGLLDWTPDGMPESVASQISTLVPPSDFVGQVAPSRRRVTKRKTRLLSRAVDIGRSIVYDSVKYHPDIKVVACGAHILFRPLRYAELNHLHELKREVLEVFEEMEILASEHNNDDARRWLNFQKQDALAVGGTPAPECPMDILIRT